MNIIIFIVLIIFGTSIAIASLSLAPWVPTRNRDLERILKLLELKHESKFYELGCGNGRVTFYIWRNTNVESMGIELSIPLFLICKTRQLFTNNDNIKFVFKNLFKLNLKDATHIYVFGMKDKLIKLKEKFIKELKPGTIIMSYVFPIEGWQPEKIDKPEKNDLPIYIYKI